MTEKAKQQIVTLVQNTFGHSYRNVNKLNWDRNRFFQSVVKHCRGCKIANSTDFNYSFCNTFEVEPKIQPDEHSYVLTFKTSFVADVYSLHVTQYSKDRKAGKVVAEDELPTLVPIIATVRQFAADAGFQEMNGGDHDIIVEGVSLELSDVATLGKCLFDDFE